MAQKNADDNNSADLYETTFNDEIEYKLEDYVSVSFLYGIIKEISDTMDISESKVQSTVSMEDGATVTTAGKNNLEHLLNDSKNITDILNN